MRCFERAALSTARGPYNLDMLRSVDTAVDTTSTLGKFSQLENFRGVYVVSTSCRRGVPSLSLWTKIGTCAPPYVWIYNNFPLNRITSSSGYRAVFCSESFYRATLCKRGICYGPVSVCVCLSVYVCHNSVFY